MSDAPDIDPQALLADAARMAHAAMGEAHRRMMAAKDDEAFERLGRVFQRECRNLRQTLALRDRLGREAASEAKAERTAREAAVRDRAESVRREAAEQVRRFIWTEYERPDWTAAAVGDVKFQLSELPDEAIAETPVAALVARLLAELGLAPRPEASARPWRAARAPCPADTS